MSFREGPRRICHLQRTEDGFGFVLCCENETTDTFVLRVLEDSPAAEAGLRPGDRILEINEINVETESHKNVVKILQGLKNIRLAVRFNREANDYFSRPDNGMTLHPLSPHRAPLRPKVVRIKKGSSGYDFVVKTVGKSPVLCSTKNRQYAKGVLAHFVDRVEKGGQAYKAGLRAGERIVEINRMSVEKESHSFVISAIKASPNRKLELLVVDQATDEYFLHQSVTPSYKHLYGEVNYPEIIDKSNYDISDSDVTPPISLYSPSIVSTNTSTPTSHQSPRLMPAISMMSVDELTMKRTGGRLTPAMSTLSVDDLTGRTEELIKELRLHSAEITRLQSSLGYSRSYVEPSLKDKYLNISSRDASSNPASPGLRRKQEYRSTTSSSDDDRSIVTNNNHTPFKYETTPRPAKVENLSDVGFNVDLKTLKEHSRRQREKNRSGQRDKPGFDNYWVAHRAVNNM